MSLAAGRALMATHPDPDIAHAGPACWDRLAAFAEVLDDRYDARIVDIAVVTLLLARAAARDELAVCASYLAYQAALARQCPDLYSQPAAEPKAP